jgi:hypothetical protein
MMRIGAIAVGTLLGWTAGGLAMDGPPGFDVVGMVLAPMVYVVPYITGREVGVDRLSFVLFLILQLAYCGVVVSVVRPSRRKSPSG